MRKQIIGLIIFLALCLVWNGVGENYSSVALSDNFQAAVLNPAALSFGNSNGVAYLQPYTILQLTNDPSSLGNNFTLFFNTPHLAYALQREEGLYINHLALSSKLSRNLYAGLTLSWSQWEWNALSYKPGLLIRPWDFLSLGFTATEPARETMSTEAAIAIRPFAFSDYLKDRVTLSLDTEFTKGAFTYPSLGVETELVDGLRIKGGYDLESQRFLGEISFSLYNFRSGSIFSFSNPTPSSFSGAAYAHISNKTFRSPQFFPPNNYLEFAPDPSILAAPPVPAFPLLSRSGTSIYDLLKEIKALKENKNIQGIIFKNLNFSAGYADFLALKNGLLDFKSSGKKIIYYYENISNLNYALAAATGDEIYLNPMGMVNLVGFKTVHPYLKGFLDKLGIEFINFASHKYKTAGNSLSESGMPDAEREALEYVYSDYQKTFVQMIESGRGNRLRDALGGVIDNGPYLGSSCLQQGLVDGLIYEDQLEEKLNDFSPNSRIIRSLPPKKTREDWSDPALPKIAIIYATGAIGLGQSAGDSYLGSDSMAAAIRHAREDKRIKGIILRVDSGGGSSLASDIIAREVKLCRTGENPKPLVVSMGNVAASGGYYIAAYADKIIANPMTLTGSIGVIAVLPNFTELAKKAEINFDTVKTAENADFADPFRPMKESERDKIKGMISSYYDKFLEVVAEGRGMDKEKVNQIAQGRIWTGEQALERNLVDKLGDFNEALATVKELAGIKGDVTLLNYSPRISAYASFLFALSQTIMQTYLAAPFDFFAEYKLAEYQGLLRVLQSDKILMISPYQPLEENSSLR